MSNTNTRPADTLASDASLGDETWVTVGDVADDLVKRLASGRDKHTKPQMAIEATDKGNSDDVPMIETVTNVVLIATARSHSRPSLSEWIAGEAVVRGLGRAPPPAFAPLVTPARSISIEAPWSALPREQPSAMPLAPAGRRPLTSMRGLLRPAAF